MKLFKKFSVTIALACLTALSATAANYDMFGEPRAIVVTPPTLLSWSTANLTNVIDAQGFLGVATIDLSSLTNAGGALSVTLLESPDMTNVTAMTNFAVVTNATAYIYTNRYFGGAFPIATNNWLLPGTLTSPVPATAGFATPYLSALQFTNTSAITVTKSGIYRVGVRAKDHARYWYVVWTPTGTSSNDFVSATFNGIKSSEVTSSQ